MTAGPASPPQPAFVYRNRAEKERRFAGGAGHPQLAFVYRNRAEKERRFGAVAGRAPGWRP